MENEEKGKAMASRQSVTVFYNNPAVTFVIIFFKLGCGK